MSIKNVFTYNTKDSSVSYTGNGFGDSTYDEATCSCSNALKEVQYTLYYNRQADGNYAINTIVANVVLYDILSFPT